MAAASPSTSLFSLARDKLQSVVSGSTKDTCSLHRWVLLKNSIIHSSPLPAAPNAASPHEADADSVYRPEEEEVFEEEEEDQFSFPDPHSLHDDIPASGNGEAQWLDSLLEGLEDGDDDDDLSEHMTSSSASPSEDSAEPLSPLYSPMSSSDDLADQSSFYHYPMPYPPVSPPVIPSWFELQAPAADDPVSTPSSPLYDSPLPYYAVDELEDSPVPDAIEDTSDDESDTPSTPSATSTSSLAPFGPASPSTPPQRTRFLSHPQVYVETDDSYFYPFESDPLPFPDDPDSARVVRPTYQEC